MSTPAQEQPSEEELRAAYEAEMQRVSSADMVLQAAVSLLNIGGYRLGSAAAGGEQPGADAPGGAAGSAAGGQAADLEQVRDAIDGVRALLPILERRYPNEVRPLRDALSQLQMAYARAAGAGAGAGPQTPPAPAGPATVPPTTEQSAPAHSRQPGQPGPAESSGRLWVPGR